MVNKIEKSLKDAIKKCGLESGMTISFHHHLRNGDYVLNMVLDEISGMGIKGITVNSSSIHDVHEPMTEHIKNGVVTGIETNYMGQAVGRAISAGIMENPVIFRTHGGRAAAIENGTSHIDVAFIAAPTADCAGNSTGKIGKSAFGSMGYAFADVQNADKVIIITDNLVKYPLCTRSIDETNVDCVVCVDSIGDPEKIVSGTTKMPKDPIALKIANTAAKVIEASGLLVDGMSFQTGAGGASLATAASLKEIMQKKGVKGSFALGGVTGYIVDMFHEGCFESIQDVQCFDLKAVESLRDDESHMEVSATEYASPFAKSCATKNLDVGVLGATEIDVDFNVNVHTDSNGFIMGGSGGHSDIAEDAKLTIIVAPLSRTRISIIKDRVGTISTPGKNVDVLVTQAGVAVNPLRPELEKSIKESGIKVVDIRELKKMCDDLNGIPQKITHKERVVAQVCDRRGVVIDKICQV